MSNRASNSRPAKPFAKYAACICIVLILAYIPTLKSIIQRHFAATRLQSYATLTTKAEFENNYDREVDAFLGPNSRRGIWRKRFEDIAYSKSLFNIHIEGKVTDQTFADLQQFPELKFLSMKNVDLSRAKIPDCAWLVQLTGLDLSGSGINDQQLRAFSNLPSLSYLNVNNTAITDNSLRTLKSMKSLESLECLKTELSLAATDELLLHTPLRILSHNLRSFDLTRTW